jgi:hypothetical protein
MIRCIRIWTGLDGHSHLEEGINLGPGPRDDTLSAEFSVASVSFQETNADPKLGWHPDPARQLVITLAARWSSRRTRAAFYFAQATYSLKTRSPVTIGGCSAIYLGGASAPSLTRLPSFHSGRPSRAQPLAGPE